MYAAANLLRIVAEIHHRPELRVPVAAGPLPDPWISGPIPESWAAGPVPDTWTVPYQRHAELEARNLALRIVDAASTVTAQGGEGAEVISRAVSDWVKVDDGDGTGKVPFRPAFPKGWAVHPPRPPRPNETVSLPAVLVSAALSLASVSVAEPSLNRAINEAVDTLVERAGSMHGGA